MENRCFKDDKMKLLTVKIPIIAFILIFLVSIFSEKSISSTIIISQFLFSIVFILTLQLYNIRSELLFFILIFLFGGIFTIVNLWLFMEVGNSEFEFNSNDGLNYHNFSQSIINLDIQNGINYFINSTKYNITDSGFIIYLSSIYKIYNSIYFARFINLIFHFLTTILLFDISKKFIDSVKLRKVLVLFFGLSSPVFFYISSGLKETIFSFIITLFIWIYLKKFNLLTLIQLLTLAFIISTFRLPVSIFLFVSMIITFNYSLRGRFIKFSFFALTLIFSFFLFQNIEDLFPYFSALSLEDRTSYGLDSVTFQVLNILAGIFGPFPTIVPSFGNYSDSLWAHGILIKNLLGFYLFIHLFNFISFKIINSKLVFITVFIFLNTISLIFVEQTFKLRYVMPYFDQILLLSFVGYESYIKLQQENKIMTSLNFIYFTLIFIFIILWNLLR